MLKYALRFMLAQRLWQGTAGIMTILVVTLTLTQEQQGWYYTFLSLAALYSLFEMGLSAALIQVAAKMFVQLQWLPNGGLAGEGIATFSSLLSQACRTYLKFALAFAVLTLLLGMYIFSHKTTLSFASNSWRWPWIFMVTLTAINMITLPFLAVVEGSGQVGEVYFLRLIQGILGAVTAWCVLMLGGWLWAALMMPLASILVVAVWLTSKRKVLIKYAFGDKSQHFNWTREIWPLQWRVGLNWVSVFMMSQLSTPILFYYQDSIVAGQMGLSLTIAHMLGLFAQSWVARRVPAMSQMVVKKQWALLDQLFKKDILHSFLVFFCGAVLLLATHYVISYTQYAARILPTGPFAGLLLFVLFYHVNGAFSMQLRSFQKEPLVWVSLIGALFIVIGSLYSAKYCSAAYVIAVMLGVQVLFVFPTSFLIWKNLNQKWRN